MTFELTMKAGYEALAAAPSCPLRVSMWEVSTSDTYTEPTTFTAGDGWLVKQGVKLWTDGSPWVGNIGISFPYLDSEATRMAGIDPATGDQSQRRCDQCTGHPCHQGGECSTGNKTDGNIDDIATSDEVFEALDHFRSLSVNQPLFGGFALSAISGPS